MGQFPFFFRKDLMVVSNINMTVETEYPFHTQSTDSVSLACSALSSSVKPFAANAIKHNCKYVTI